MQKKLRNRIESIDPKLLLIKLLPWLLLILLFLGASMTEVAAGAVRSGVD
ncbi:MAG: hypothetical protein ACFFFG_11310 [Candidatus Thorarchaeota archaeon]